MLATHMPCHPTCITSSSLRQPEGLIVRVLPTTYLNQFTYCELHSAAPVALAHPRRASYSRNAAQASAYRSTLSATETITRVRMMPNGVPYDGSRYNNDLGPGAYPANIAHGTYFSSVVNAVTGYSIYLPPEDATNPNQRFNVIYFLSGQGFGSGATENSEVTNDPELISNLQLIPPTIMVFPNPYQNSKYMDAAPQALNVTAFLVTGIVGQSPGVI